MGRLLAGAMAMLLLVAGGLFWWQGRASNQPVPQLALASPPPPQIEGLPEGDAAATGDAPPMPAEASPQSREQRRFARYDRDRDGVITRIEMLGSRTKAFKALDKDGDNLLSFDEVLELGDQYAATAPKRSLKPKCRC